MESKTRPPHIARKQKYRNLGFVIWALKGTIFIIDALETKTAFYNYK